MVARRYAKLDASMTFPASRFACALLVSIVGALPCSADSLASSASSAGSASVGSLSDSVHSSSGKSTDKVAEGDYRIIDVAAAGRSDTLRVKMQHVAPAGDDSAVIYLDVPRPALGDRAAALGDIVGVRQRPYGYEFAWADTRVPFFLVLAADWQRELEPRPVQF
jgi:hypothetical protein